MEQSPSWGASSQSIKIILRNFFWTFCNFFEKLYVGILFFCQFYILQTVVVLGNYHIIQTM